jgi:uncharacterized membrane protein YeaQ/YmgE (transglycosylase-associated protein family)
MGGSTDTRRLSASEDLALRHVRKLILSPGTAGVPRQHLTEPAYRRSEDPMLGTILGLLVIGLVAGFIARAIVPGRQSMSILQTILLGLAGSFVGGLLGRLLFGSGDSLVQPSSWIGSIIGAVIVLVIYMQIKRRSRTDARAAE